MNAVGSDEDVGLENLSFGEGYRSLVTVLYVERSESLKTKPERESTHHRQNSSTCPNCSWSTRSFGASRQSAKLVVQIDSVVEQPRCTKVAPRVDLGFDLRLSLLGILGVLVEGERS
jgi:hypothetical protein